MPKEKTAALMPAQPTLMVVDGHSIVYRAYFALLPRMALNVRSTGEPSGAVYGFVNMFLRAWADVRPTYWAIAFDRAAPTFRDALYSEYKAGRAAAPDELRLQFARVRAFAGALGMPILEMDGYEADDILGTLSRMATEHEMETVLLTGDTDTLQLVSPHVTVRYMSGKGNTDIYDVAKVRERYKIEPGQFRDFKAIKGDPSDNIPNVPTIGDVTATKLLQKYGDIDNLFEHIEEVEPVKHREVLKQHHLTLLSNRKLVTIVRDMPLEFDFEQGRVDRYDRPKVIDFLREMEFQSMAGRLPDLEREQRSVAVTEAVPQEYETVRSLGGVEALVKELRAAGRFALDVESSSPLAMTGELVGLAFAPAPAGKAYYVPLAHKAGEQAPKDEALAALKPLFEDPRVEKITHNGKFDVLVLAGEGITLRGLAADVIIAAYLAGAKSLNINAQAFERLGVEIPAPGGFLGTGSKAVTMPWAPIEAVAAYAAARASAALRLWPIYAVDLAKDGQQALLSDMEMPLLPVLAKMERIGVAIDGGVLREMSRELSDRLFEIERQAYDSVGHMFAINSPSQLGTLLFEELKLPKAKKTKTGYSTDAQVLEGLKDAHPVINQVLEYRQLSKLKSTYVDSLPEMVNPRTHRLHTTLSQTVAATGRLSSSDPNLQNIPVRTELGKRIRDAFVAEGRDWTLLSADYSQIELRVLAHMSEDAGLTEAFSRNEDIHSATASQVFNVPIKEVTPDQRRFAKVVNFGLVYGMGEFGLASRADTTREQAAPIIQEYFRKYPGILKYLDETKKMAREKGYVETMLGRRRYLPEVHAGNFQVRAAAERMAVNMPIQGTAADIIKLAMINLDKRMEATRMKSRMILQVHDELIFETPQDELEAMKGLVQELMPHAVELKVPLRVDMKVGRTWGDMEPGA